MTAKKGKCQGLVKSLNIQNKSEQNFFPTKHSNEKFERILYTLNDYVNIYDIYVIIYDYI